MNSKNKTLRRLKSEMAIANEAFNTKKQKGEFNEPDKWTIITALNRVLEVAEDSQLSDELWETCKKPLAFLRRKLRLTNVQIVILAIMVEFGEAMSWKRIGNFLGCTRLSIMVYSEEIEELVSKRWVIKRATREIGGMYDGFAYETLVRELGELGYDTKSQILNAADYGAPQIRYRTVVLGWKRGLPPLDFPPPTNGNKRGLRPYLTLMEAISDLPPIGAGESSSDYAKPPQNEYQRRMRGEQKKLLEHNASNYGEKMQEILRLLATNKYVVVRESLKSRTFTSRQGTRLERMDASAR